MIYLANISDMVHAMTNVGMTHIYKVVHKVIVVYHISTTQAALYMCSGYTLYGGYKDDNSSVRLDHVLTPGGTCLAHTVPPSVGGNTVPLRMH